MSDDRQTAYNILLRVSKNAAEIWSNGKWDVMAQWPKSLSEMEGDLALAVVQGIIREQVFGEDTRRFKYHHRPLSRDEYDELWEVVAS